MILSSFCSEKAWSEKVALMANPNILDIVYVTGRKHCVYISSTYNSKPKGPSLTNAWIVHSSVLTDDEHSV